MRELDLLDLYTKPGNLTFTLEACGGGASEVTGKRSDSVMALGRAGVSCGGHEQDSIPAGLGYPEEGYVRGE